MHATKDALTSKESRSLKRLDETNRISYYGKLGFLRTQLVTRVGIHDYLSTTARIVNTSVKQLHMPQTTQTHIYRSLYYSTVLKEVATQVTLLKQVFFLENPSKHESRI